MKLEDVQIGEGVVYIPSHLEGEEIKDDQLGIVSSKNKRWVFVKYMTSETSQATNAEDLYPLKNRPDLRDRLSLPLNENNKIDEIYINTHKNLK